MRYITTPDPVKIVGFDNKAKGPEVELGFREFIVNRLEDQKFGKSMATVLAAFRIHEAVKSVIRGTLHLEDADWKLLKDVVENPSVPYNPTISRCLIPFMRAIVEAPDRKADTP